MRCWRSSALRIVVHAVTLGAMLAVCGACASGSEPVPPSAPAGPLVAPPEPTATDPAGASASADSARAWLGIELTAEPPGQPGVAVGGVVPGSPAALAGVQPGDVLLRLDGHAVQGPADVVRSVEGRRVGERVGLVLRRGDRERLFAVTLAPRPDEEGVMRMSYVGASAPPFDSLHVVEGNLAPQLGALRGQVVVLEFWARWCLPCHLLVPIMNRWSHRFAAEGVRVIGVTAASIRETRAAAVEVGIHYAVLADPTANTTRAYRAIALPTVFVIDRRGVVRDVMVGYSSRRIDELAALIARLAAEP
jgi:peroxiredoxin